MKLLLCDTINIIVVLTAGNSQIEEIDAAKSTDRESAQATDLGTYYVATKNLSCIIYSIELFDMMSSHAIVYMPNYN